MPCRHEDSFESSILESMNPIQTTDGSSETSDHGCQGDAASQVPGPETTAQTAVAERPLGCSFPNLVTAPDIGRTTEPQVTAWPTACCSQELGVVASQSPSTTPEYFSLGTTVRQADWAIHDTAEGGLLAPHSNSIQDPFWSSLTSYDHFTIENLRAVRDWTPAVESQSTGYQASMEGFPPDVQTGLTRPGDNVTSRNQVLSSAKGTASIFAVIPETGVPILCPVEGLRESDYTHPASNTFEGSYGSDLRRSEFLTDVGDGGQAPATESEGDLKSGEGPDQFAGTSPSAQNQHSGPPPLDRALGGLRNASPLALHHLAALDVGFSGRYPNDRMADHSGFKEPHWEPRLGRDTWGGGYLAPGQRYGLAAGLVTNTADETMTIRFPWRTGTLTCTREGWYLGGRPVPAPGEGLQVENVNRRVPIEHALDTNI